MDEKKFRTVSSVRLSPYLSEPFWVDPEVTFRILRRTGVLFGKISKGIFQQMVFAIVLGKMCF